MAQGLKPSDNPVIVREFETRLLLLVLPVFFVFFIVFIYIFLNGSWCPLFYFFLTGSWCPLFFVILVFSFLFFNYTPMEVVPPVGMLVSTAPYTLAADGAVLNTPNRRRRQYDTRYALTI